MHIITGRITDIEERPDGRLLADVATKRAGTVQAFVSEELAAELGPGSIIALIVYEADGTTYYAVAENSEEVVGAMSAGSKQGKAARPADTPAALVVATYLEIAERLQEAKADPALASPAALAALTRETLALTRPMAPEPSARPPATPETATPAQNRTSRPMSRSARS